MTEAQWLACDDLAGALRWVGLYKGGGADKRRARLLACACCRRLWAPVPDDMQELLSLAERHADKRVKGKSAKKLLSKRDRHILDDRTRAVTLAGFLHDDLDALRDAIESARDAIAWEVYDSHFARLARDVREVSRDTTGDQVVGRAKAAESREQMLLVRDIFGNPFRPVAFSPEWRTDTAVALARQMYEARDFSALPILADALQDAGCTSADVLTHCRGHQEGVPGEPVDLSPVQTGPHVRGCWVVDFVLAKA
jgi:hypothetical protein